YYERNLPHWHPEGTVIFLTWRLHGSLPTALVQQAQSHEHKSGQQFADFDRHLDRARFGPIWLKIPAIADSVVTTLRRGQDELNQYILHAYVVMANHVHVLLAPRIELAHITRGIKGVTARNANRILGRTGEPFWQDESFDHWVRDSAEEERIRIYVERNPVKAGLAIRPEDWPWSSAHR
ncbi:MAG: transposase, partial [Candidatus Acidiferrum sp.]